MTILCTLRRIWRRGSIDADTGSPCVCQQRPEVVLPQVVPLHLRPALGNLASSVSAFSFFL
jgi:hypothetical protein